MSHKLVDLDVLEDEFDGINSFEVIMGSVERATLNGEISVERKNEIESLILLTERFLQDLDEYSNNFRITQFNDEDGKTQNELRIALISSCESFLKYIAIMLTQNPSDENANFLIKNLKQLVMYLEIINKLLKRNILIPKTTFTDFSEFLHIFLSKTTHGLNSTLMGLNSSKTYVWDITLLINNKDDAKSIYSLWIFLESLKNIKGAKVVLEDIKKGSILSKIKLYLSSDEAKDEAAELLTSSKKFAKGKLEKDHLENQKVITETEKIKAEKEQIEAKSRVDNSDYAEKKRILELKNLEEELEKKRIENETARIKLFVEKKNIFAQLLSENIISNDEYILTINNQLFLHKKDDTIIPSNDSTSINTNENKNI